jgi:hypothetical protein
MMNTISKLTVLETLLFYPIIRLFSFFLPLNSISLWHDSHILENQIISETREFFVHFGQKISLFAKQLDDKLVVVVVDREHRSLEMSLQESSIAQQTRQLIQQKPCDQLLIVRFFFECFFERVKDMLHDKRGKKKRKQQKIEKGKSVIKNISYNNIKSLLFNPESLMICFITHFERVFLP